MEDTFVYHRVIRVIRVILRFVRIASVVRVVRVVRNIGFLELLQLLDLLQAYNRNDTASNVYNPKIITNLTIPILATRTAIV